MTHPIAMKLLVDFKMTICEELFPQDDKLWIALLNGFLLYWLRRGLKKSSQ